MRRQHVEDNLGPRSSRDVLQAVLTQERVQPHQSRIQESQRRLAGGRELPNVELEVAYRTVSGREQGRAGQVKACLLERGQRFADLRIVSALGAKRLARLLERGLRILDLRLSGVQLRLCLVAPCYGVDA